MRQVVYGRVLVVLGIGLLAACDAEGGNQGGNPFEVSKGGAGGGSGASGGGVAGAGGSGGTGTTSRAGSGGSTAVVTAGSGARGGMGGAGMSGGGTGASGMGGTSGGSAGMAAGTTGGGAGTVSTSDRSPDGTCARWKMDRMNLSEGTWSGSTASCEAGDISADGRANALRLINLYRWLADLPPVETSDEFNRKAQACALMQRANNSLSHTPPMTWMCYTADGADGAGSCNISTGPGVSSVAGYMVDPGNPTTIGHRRWILSNRFGPTGLGSTDRHSCMWTFGTGRLTKPWMAWPPPGPFPVQAMGGGFGQNTDQTGWTVQSDTINLAGAQVKVTVDGADQPVTVTQLMPGYGSRYAFRFNPMGWTTTAGKTYKVSVTGIPTPIEYEIQVLACP